MQQRGCVPELLEVDLLRSWSGRLREKVTGCARRTVLAFLSWGIRTIFQDLSLEFWSGVYSIQAVVLYTIISFFGRNIIQNFSNIADNRSQTNL